MPATKEKIWLCVYEMDGARHVIKATNDADEALTRKHIQQINKDLKIVELRVVKDISEIEAVADRLRADPYHVPHTNADIVTTETTRLD